MFPVSSHEVFDCNATVVAVAVDAETSETLVETFSEGVSNNTVAGLKADFWLEGVLTDGANHLEGNIGAIK